MRLILCLLVGISLFFASCGKEEEITQAINAKLSFSADSIIFDTVFTTTGSTSRRLKIYNKNPNAIVLNQVQLSGGTNSPFSLNINGIATTDLDYIKINGNDSINVFVKININQNDETLPFIVQDSILFHYNGQQQNIALVAYGQNANFITEGSITKHTTWNSKLPYIIYKSLSVEKDAKLNIAAGTRIFFHSNSTLNVKGTLVVNGTKKDSVLFASDRLEKIYSEEPGQWNGIHFYPSSKDSHINYAIIKNGVAGITMDSLSTNNAPKLLLTNTIIKNMEVVGFLGYQTQLTAFNNLFTNCKQYLFYVAGGGSYNIKHNTFAALSNNYSRKTAAVYFTDFVSSSQYDHINLDFTNNIVWGNIADEFVIAQKALATIIKSNVTNNLLKSTTANLKENGNLLNIDPQFVDANKNQFQLKANSVGIKAGFDIRKDEYFDKYLSKDLLNNKRNFPFDIGSYENK